MCERRTANRQSIVANGMNRMSRGRRGSESSDPGVTSSRSADGPALAFAVAGLVAAASSVASAALIGLVAFLAVVTVLGASSAAAQGTSDDIAQRAADPTRSPLSLQGYAYHTPDVYGVPGSLTQLVFRPVIPYRAFGVDNILRFTFTYTTSGPMGRDGLNDLQVLQLSIVERWGGRFAFGLSGSAPVAADGLGFERWTIGPSVGHVTTLEGGVLVGALLQSFFSVGGSSDPDVAQVAIQPVMAIPFGGGRTLSLGNAGVVYDAERSRWASVAPSLQWSWMTSVGGVAVRPQVELTHELRDLTGSPKTTFRIGAQVLL